MDRGAPLCDAPGVSAPEPIVDVSRSLVSAVHASLGSPLEPMLDFDALVRGGPSGPDFTEHSVAFDSTLAAARLTHYFDVQSGDERRAAIALARFRAVVQRFGHGGSTKLLDRLDELASGARSLLQVVLGIDARPSPGSTRTKLYFLLSEPDAGLVEAVRCAADMPALPNLDPAQVFLLGLDFGEGGVSELKSYLRLDIGRLDRIVRSAPDVELLLRQPKAAVLSQPHRRPERRQLHLHAGRVAFHTRWLAERAAHQPALDALNRHVHAVESCLGGERLEPYIVGLPLHEGQLDPRRGNVYLHVTDIGFRGPLAGRVVS